jgi:hypothetical protein
VNHGDLRDDRLRQDVEASYRDVFTACRGVNTMASLYSNCEVHVVLLFGLLS